MLRLSLLRVRTWGLAAGLLVSVPSWSADVAGADLHIDEEFGDAEGIWAWIDNLEGVPDQADLTEKDLERIREHAAKKPTSAAEIDRSADIERPEVARFITYFTTTSQGRKTYSEWLQRAARYRPIIDAGLEKRKLPRELFYVAMAESGYDPRSYSPTHAAGLWQFIPRTGVRYGLRVDSWVDERRDPALATGAALDYLTDLHGQFGDWLLAYASYNWGEHRVAALMDSSGKKDFWSLLKTRRVPKETSNYVPLIVACAHIGADLEGYGFTADGDDALAYDTIRVDRTVGLEDLAREAKASKRELLELNLALRRGATPPEGYDLRIPRGEQLAFASAIQAAPAWTPPQPTKKRVLRYARHKVRKGETLSQIAKKYGTSTRTLVKANGLRSANRIYAGMTLKIPRYVWITVDEAPVTVAKVSEPAPRAATPVSTSDKPAPEPAAAKPAPVKTAPVKAAPRAPAVRTVKYTIKRGDTLSQIAQRYGITTQELQRQNNITNPSRIYAGQVITIRYRS